jgi:hypothetical protein
MGLLLPLYNTADAGDGYYYVRRYAYLGDTPARMLLTALLSPHLWVGRLLAADRLAFLLRLIGPLLFVPLAGGELLIGFLPVFGYLLLADSPDQYAIDRHYLAPLLAPLFFALVVGLRRIGRWAAVPVAIAVVASGYAFGPTPFGRGYDPGVDRISSHTAVLRGLVGQVPPAASVSASRNLLSWFSQRTAVFRFPEVRDAQYVVLDYRELRHPGAFGLDDGALGRMIGSADYRLIDADDGALFFERGDPSVWPTARAGVATRFGDTIELVDYSVAPAEGGLSVRLVWRAIAKPPIGYTVFAHALDGRGERIAQADGPPADGLLPTDTWTPGHVVPDRRRLPNAARVQVGLYDAATGKRLPVSARGLPGGVDWVDLPGGG